MNRRGLSLIEVMVSTSLLGMLGLILLLFFVGSAGPLRQASHREFALTLASQQLEEARWERTAPPSPISWEGPDGCNYQVEVKVADVAGFAPSELRVLRVNVHWKERGRLMQVEQCRYSGHVSL